MISKSLSKSAKLGDAELSQLKLLTCTFDAELEHAYKGSKSEFGYVLQDLPVNGLVNAGEVFQVLVLGASHWERALVRSVNGATEILKFQRGDLPVIVGKAAFFQFIQKKLYPKVQTVSLVLAKNLTPFQRGNLVDGIITHSHTKSRLQDLVGMQAGLELEHYFTSEQNSFQRTIRFSVYNNIVSLALLKQTQRTFNWNQTVTGVVATGINFGFFETEKRFVNLESGNVSVEGNTVSEIAGSVGILNEFNAHSTSITLSTFDEFKDILDDKNHPDFILASHLIQKSARVVAAQIAAISGFKKRHFNVQKLKFILTGDLFWKVAGYKASVEYYMERLGVVLGSVVFENHDKAFVHGAVRLAVKIRAKIRKKVAFEVRVRSLFRSFVWYQLAPPIV